MKPTVYRSTDTVWAVQVNSKLDYPALAHWVYGNRGRMSYNMIYEHAHLSTDEGPVKINPTDWVVMRSPGHFEVLPDDVFQFDYQP